ncbi:IS3 family transposase [Kineococcus sp. SYSU DK002]|uniref:IS3 family transposase n=1 Tax=Kineococcus sp. SYSU DK002 TaxID=3383123 RepID=UPI003D7C790A
MQAVDIDVLERASAHSTRESLPTPRIPPPVRDLADDALPVAVTCRVLGVSRSSHCAWRDLPASEHSAADAALTQTITEGHASSRATCGAPRVHAELPSGRGAARGRERVARPVRAAGLVGVCRRRERPGSEPLPAPREDLVRHRSLADEPDRLWVSDITGQPPAKVRCTAPQWWTSSAARSWAGPPPIVRREQVAPSTPNSSSTPSTRLAGGVVRSREPSSAPPPHPGSPRGDPEIGCGSLGQMSRVAPASTTG